MQFTSPSSLFVFFSNLDRLFFISLSLFVLSFIGGCCCSIRESGKDEPYGYDDWAGNLIRLDSSFDRACFWIAVSRGSFPSRGCSWLVLFNWNLFAFWLILVFGIAISVDKKKSIKIEFFFFFVWLLNRVIPGFDARFSNWFFFECLRCSKGLYHGTRTWLASFTMWMHFKLSRVIAKNLEFSELCWLIM